MVGWECRAAVRWRWHRRRSRRALLHRAAPPRRTLNMMPAMVVPVLVNPGPFTPCFSKKSFRLHRSKAKPPSPAAAMAGHALLVRSGGDQRRAGPCGSGDQWACTDGESQRCDRQADELQVDVGWSCAAAGLRCDAWESQAGTTTGLLPKLTSLQHPALDPHCPFESTSFRTALPLPRSPSAVVLSHSSQPAPLLAAPACRGGRTEQLQPWPQS